MDYNYLNQAATQANPYASGNQANGYLNTFLSYYNNLANQQSNAGQGMWQPNYQGGSYDVGNAGMGYMQPYSGGLGMFDVGQAGLGQFDVGQSGLGQFNVGQSGLGRYNVNDVGQGQFNLSKWMQSGAGDVYGSDLLNQLTGRVSQNLANPNASLAMGLAKDWITGQGRASQQELDNRLAGWGRGYGVGNQMRDQLTGDLNRTASDMYRQIAMDTERQSISDAMGLEGMKGGFFNDAQRRQLELAGIDATAYENAMRRAMGLEEMKMSAAESDWARQLQNAGLGLQAFEGAKGRELQNTGLGLQAFDSAKGRELQNTGLGLQSYGDAMSRAMQYAGLDQDAFQNAMARELQNAQLGGEMYNAEQNRMLDALGLSLQGYEGAKSRELQNAQLTNQMGGQNLGALGNMLQWAGSQQNPNQYFENLMQLAQLGGGYQPLSDQQKSDMMWLQQMQGGGGMGSMGMTGGAMPSGMGGQPSGMPSMGMGGFGGGSMGVNQMQPQQNSMEAFQAKQKAQDMINSNFGDNPYLSQYYGQMLSMMTDPAQIQQFILQLMKSGRSGGGVANLQNQPLTGFDYNLRGGF